MPVHIEGKNVFRSLDIGEGNILKKGTNKVEICRTNTLVGMLDGTWFDYEQHCLKQI